MLKIITWDVQHGNAIFIDTPNKNFVVDLGTGTYANNKEFSPLKHLNKKYGIEQIDNVIISHQHRDHLDDIFNFDSVSPKVLTHPNHLTDSDIKEDNRNCDEEVIDKYLEIRRRYTGSVAEDPKNPSNNGGVDIKFFLTKDCSKSNLNNHSLVLVIQYNSYKFLIPGDNESPSWNNLLDNDDFISAISGTNILFAPHHGRQNGYHSDLFSYISPQLTIISDGRFNDTSATSRYSSHSSGKRVERRTASSETRYCVTTRNDGVVYNEVGLDVNSKRYLKTVID